MRSRLRMPNKLKSLAQSISLIVFPGLLENLVSV